MSLGDAVDGREVRDTKNGGAANDSKCSVSRDRTPETFIPNPDSDVE